MKKIKIKTGLAFGALAAFCTSPSVVKAATEAAEETRSRGEVMKYALLNTVMSIAIVFCALLLISWIIGLFKYINKFETKLAEKKAAKSAQAEPETPAAESIAEEEELSDDLELAAVITAAITAYEEANGVYVPADGLVVRSIKKVNKTRWQNA